MVRVLHVVSTLGGGGVAQMLVNYFQKIDTSEIEFDFIVHGDKVGHHEEFFSKHGCQIYHAPPKRSAPLKNISFISNIIKNGNYDVIHAHQNLSNLVPLGLAKFYKIPMRISHGHGYPSLPRPVEIFCKKSIERNATDFFACSNDVGKWLHPNRWNEGNNSHVMLNALNLNNFAYNSQSRDNWREKLGLQGKRVMIQIGRLSPEKNHEFTLSLLRRLQLGPQYKVLFVGDGPLEDHLKNKVQEFGLSNTVEFLGFQKDIPGLLSAADLALMPSITEGAPVAAIEAQAANLPLITSNVVPKDLKLTSLINILPLDQENWADLIIDFNWNGINRCQYSEEKLKSFDINLASKRYRNYILAALESRPFQAS